MAKQTKKSAELGELIRRSEASRAQLSRTHAKVKRGLNVPAKMARAVKSNPFAWVAGSAAVGLFGSFLFSSKKEKIKAPEKSMRKSRGFVMGSLALAITLIRPFAKTYGMNLLKDYLRNQLTRGAMGRANTGEQGLR